MFVDRTLTCVECGQDFAFTAGEQEFFESRGFTVPKRCPGCRAARRSRRSSGDFEGDRPRRDRPRRMFDVVCAECGAPCQVPFEPKEDRPVYCDACFRARRSRRY